MAVVGNDGAGEHVVVINLAGIMGRVLTVLVNTLWVATDIVGDGANDKCGYTTDGGR
jgi:hypothetical protein